MRHDGGTCAARLRLIQIMVRVEILAHQRDKQFTLADPARIRGHAFDLRQQQRQPRPFAVVEGQLFPSDVLIGFVALARQQHHVFRGRRPDGLQDGARAVDLNVGAGGFRNTGKYLFDDGLGRLGAGVVAGHHHMVGKFGGDAAHHRPLARIALAAATKHADQAARARHGHGAQREQRARQRIRRVRVIHHHQRASGLVAHRHRLDGLKTAVHGVGRREFARDLRERQAQLVQHARHEQQIRDIVRAQQARHDLGFAVRRDQREDLALGRGLQVARAHGGGNRGIVAQAVAHWGDAGGQAGDQPAPGLVIGVDHGGCQARPAEQARLRLFIALHRDVIVEVVAREVRERGQRHAHAVHPALLDADRRRLHRDCPCPGIAHRGKRAVHRQHIGSRQVAAQRTAVGQHRAQRADGAAGLVIAAQRVGDPLNRRGLAIGAGHRHHRQRGRRATVPGVAQFAQQRAQAGHGQHGGLCRHRLDGIAGGRFEQHRAGAQRQRLVYIETSVAGQPRAGDEHIARLDIARVQLEMRGQRYARMQPRHDFSNRGDRGREEAFGAHLPGSLRPATIVDSNGASGRTPISLRLPPTI
ncbi:hypothetical protein D3C86_885990 [compost metagenome]